MNAEHATLREHFRRQQRPVRLEVAGQRAGGGVDEDLVNNLDPKLVAAFGMTGEGVLTYFGDRIDPPTGPPSRTPWDSDADAFTGSAR